jgi:hypothetical protein
MSPVSGIDGPVVQITKNISTIEDDKPKGRNNWCKTGKGTNPFALISFVYAFARSISYFACGEMHEYIRGTNILQVHELP